MASPRWLRLAVELLPEIVLTAGLAFFALDEPDAAFSAFGSGRAITLMAVTSIVWIVARVLAGWLVPWRLARIVTFGAAALGVLAVVVLPAYDDTTVIETFPVANAAPATPDTTPSPTVAPSTGPRGPVGSTETPATVAPDVSPAPVPTVLPVPTVPRALPMPTVPPVLPVPTTVATPAAVRRAVLTGIDHRATGMVVVYRDVDGTFVVGLEEIDIQPGPDYDVYVVAGSDRDDVDGGIRLDDLRGNIGTQYYEAPDDVDLATGDWTVVVWCETFDVPIANATPT